jgi:hypothetical protein
VATRVRRGLLVAIGILYVVSVPWYRSGGGEPEIWLGMPDWAAVAVVCYAAVAVLNALAWLLCEVHDVQPDPADVGLNAGPDAGPGENA